MQLVARLLQKVISSSTSPHYLLGSFAVQLRHEQITNRRWLTITNSSFPRLSMSFSSRDWYRSYRHYSRTSTFLVLTLVITALQSYTKPIYYQSAYIYIYIYIHIYIYIYIYMTIPIPTSHLTMQLLYLVNSIATIPTTTTTTTSSSITQHHPPSVVGTRDWYHGTRVRRCNYCYQFHDNDYFNRRLPFTGKFSHLIFLSLPGFRH